MSKSKRVFSMLAVLAVVVMGIPSQAFAFTGAGFGTEENPYRIKDCDDLLDIQNDLDGYYVVTRDIDCEYGGMYPINTFTGTFDGQNYTISGIDVQSDLYSPGYAIFGNTDGATLQNVNIEDSQIEGDTNTGSLVGWAEDTTITNVHSSAEITRGRNATGGIVGRAESNVTISRVSYTGSMVNSTAAAGGLVGYLNQSSSLSNSFYAGEMTVGTSLSGGVVGFVDAGSSVTRTYSSGDVTGASSTFGGLVGQLDDSTLTESFSSSVLTNDDEHGGAVGTVSGTGSTTDVYYNEFVCDCTDGVVTGTDDTTGVNAANATPNYFLGNNTNAPLDSWDFDEVWETNVGAHPTLQEESTPADSDDDGVSDDIENAGPNDGDADASGVPDAAESNVASAPNDFDNEYSVLTVSEQCSIKSLVVIEESDVATPGDEDYEFPGGFMDFRLDCGEAGFEATITQIYFNLDEEDYVLRKYKPGTGFFEIEADVSDDTVGIEPVKTAEYTVVDGSSYDLDGEEDGFIEDPAGLGLYVGETLAETGLEQNFILSTAVSLIALGGFWLLRDKSAKRSVAIKFDVN